MSGVMFSLSSVMSFMFSVLGVLISLVSLNLLGVWVGIELNFLAVLCFMSGSSVEETEGVMKYYMVQILGSCFSMMGFLMMVNGVEMFLGSVFILLGMLIKLGAFPFYFWVAPVVSKLSWPACKIVLVLQKVTPLWVVSNCLFLGWEISYLELLCVLTCCFGCLGGLGILNYRVLLGFSSIQHLGCLMILSCCSSWSMWMYLIGYSVLNIGLMISLWVLNISSFLDLSKASSLENLSSSWWVSVYMLSIAGLPPFSGCALKTLFLISCWGNMSVGGSLCMLTSCVSLVFYLSVVLAMTVYWGKSIFKMKKSSNSYFYVGLVSIMINLAIGPLLFSFSSL
ncbi:NADH dehydrogenase subunit 2 (mitochondrion) [Ruditapes philippinarum]|uniref:NADH-ubiquinone oxidoreductase chain 2 n=1 Tax=Ruditapes philippinarum TaxID=129788 RepID=A0A0H4SPG0_RUDPH|nr:NADH dehydrogenase subunit 2 [Ruditapes philippinarum]AKP94723.1 NADH dehydrogenase subunit 2 [Ruditapes philippinarum]